VANFLLSDNIGYRLRMQGITSVGNMCSTGMSLYSKCIYVRSCINVFELKEGWLCRVSIGNYLILLFISITKGLLRVSMVRALVNKMEGITISVKEWEIPI
jgi:hypothetical protein